jgi:hypothetical protein
MRGKNSIDNGKVGCVFHLFERRFRVGPRVPKHAFDKIPHVDARACQSVSVKLGVSVPKIVRSKKIMGVKSSAVFA